MDVKTDADFDKYKGQLKDKIVLISDIRETKADFTGMGSRFTDEELAKMEAAQPAVPGAGGPRPQGAGNFPITQLDAAFLSLVIAQTRS